jgi:peroxiredoxin (alkyl hydroperoxide reductase subunit C)
VFNMPVYDPIKDEDLTINLESLAWKWIVLFFYPADFTFVCPTELKDMADNKNEFDELWVEMLVCSTDTVYSHRWWINQEKLMVWFPYKMLSDHNLETSYVYNILDENSWMAWRWTFIIDPDGIVRWIEITSWPLGRDSGELIRKIQALQFMRENPGTVCPARWHKWDKTLNPSIKIAGDVYSAMNS